MSFYLTLVENFFANECDPERLDEIRAVLDIDDPPPVREFGGNVWTAKIDFQNGVDTLIAEQVVPTGTLKEIRFVLGDRNSIKINSFVSAHQGFPTPTNRARTRDRRKKL